MPLQEGLSPVEGFFLADSYGDDYTGLSLHDAVTLAIAENRGTVRMTRGKRLRPAANERVAVIGTIDMLDRLLNEGRIKESLGWLSPNQYRRSLGMAA